MNSPSKLTNTAILLVHGFAGTPHELEYLEKRLTLEGYPVFAPTLPGHGISKKALAKTNPKMWLEFIQNELNKLTQTFDNVIVIGFSLGGLLSTHLASSPKISKLIFINTPIWVFNIPIILGDILIPKKNWLAYIKRYKSSASKAGPKSLLHFWRFMHAARPNFAQIKTPALIIQSSQDETARPKSGLFINNSIPNSKLVKIDGTRHQIFSHSDALSDEVCGHILEFINS